MPISQARTIAFDVLRRVETQNAYADEVLRAELGPVGPCRSGRASRAAVVERLSHTPGKHLVIVRYPEGYNVHDDWVFNGAEIDSAKLLWARETNPQQNQKLLDYFKDRQIWLIEPEEDNTELIPYPHAATPTKN